MKLSRSRIPLRNMYDASAGTTTRATITADTMASMMLIAIGWNSLASTPSKLNRGMKTTRIIAVAKKIGRATSRPASCSRSAMPRSSCDASSGSGSPSANSFRWASCSASGWVRCLKMFSTITTEPSTSMPIATAIPPRDIRLAERPNQAMIIRAIPMEIGIESSTSVVARRFIRNRASTIAINTKANRSALVTVSTALVTRSAWL